MKEQIAIGAAAGLVLSALAWSGHRGVDPNTVSLFPDGMTLLAALLLFLGIVWMIRRRVGVTDAASLTLASWPAVVTVASIHGAFMAYLSSQRWSYVTTGRIVLVGLMSAVEMLAIGMVCAAIFSRIVLRRKRVAI